MPVTPENVYRTSTAIISPLPNPGSAPFVPHSFLTNEEPYLYREYFALHEPREPDATYSFIIRSSELKKF
jgi:hypothetical protein